MTNKEIIQATWPEHAQRILELCYNDRAGLPINADNYLNAPGVNPYAAINGCFLFYSTDEGHDYWMNLAERA